MLIVCPFHSFQACGYKVFQFEFHLPYFALSTTAPVNDCPWKLGTSNQRERWIDMSFLNTQPPSEFPRLYGIRQAQFSLAICGSDNRRWIAYAFEDTDPGSEDLTPENLSLEGVHDPDAEEDEQQGKPPNWDPIRDEPDPRELDANQAIWDPREYFLIGMEVGIAKPLKAWEYLVRSLERGIEQYVCLQFIAGHSGAERNGPSDTKKALEWTVNAKGVLNQLSGVISKTNKAWEGFFSESDGDIGYFSDMVGRNSPQSRAILSLNNTKVAFETLETLKERLDLLDKSCSTLAKL